MNTIPIPPGMNTKKFIMSSGAIADTPELLKEVFPGKKAFIIADENTMEAAGYELLEYLKSGNIEVAGSIIYPGNERLHCENDIAIDIASKYPENIVPIAVGSGTINDLVKRASEIAQIPYCCVATACSVDGYTSNGSALTYNGFKQTMKATAPLAVVADSNVLATAPDEMRAAGYADLMAKLPGGADWLLVDTLGMEPIVPHIWDLVQTKLKDNLSDPLNYQKIFDGLVATGYAMQLYADSRPASGAEHMFSHVWEMENLSFNGEVVSHGFKVAIGTIISTILMEYVIYTDVETARRKAQAGKTKEERMKEIEGLLDKDIYGNEQVKIVAMEKFLTGADLAGRRELIYRHWETIQNCFRKQIYPYKELIAKFEAAKCPVRPSQIGLTKEQFFHGVRTAQLIRKRYTILDMLYDAGLFDDAVATLEFFAK
jgi:glycerol-1-phosphate dehydrogenase [NAD(P)+]